MKLAALVLPVLVLALACHAPPGDEGPGVDRRQARQIPAAMQADVGCQVRDNTDFACELYRQVKGAEGNVFLSPHSISTALAMTWAGTRGGTEADMARALHFTLGQARLHPAFGALQQSLDLGRGFGGYRLEMANQLFGQAGLAWQPDFLDALRRHYLAPLQELDFAASPEPARELLNRWVLNHTGGAVPELFPTGTISRETRLVLANALHFKGQWVARFPPAATRDEPFHRVREGSITVPFMHQTREFPHVRLDDVEVLELPFEGQDVAMLLVLPEDPSGLPALEARLDAATLERWRGALRTCDLSVSLPRFTLHGSFTLQEALSGLGMASAFRSDADFSGMDGARDLCLAAVLHKATLTVDEDGATATAATGIAGIASAPMPMVLDHPFLVFIVDRVTGAVLFLGRVADPSRT